MTNIDLPIGDTVTYKGTYPNIATMSDYTFVLCIDDAVDGDASYTIMGTDIDEDDNTVLFHITHAISKELTANKKYYVQAKVYDANKTLVKSTPTKPAVLYAQPAVKEL